MDDEPKKIEKEEPANESTFTEYKSERTGLEPVFPGDPIKRIIPENVVMFAAEKNWNPIKTNAFVDIMTTAGFNLDEVDPDWLEKILHIFDNTILGDKIPDNWEGFVAQTIAQLINILGDKKITKKDVPKIKTLFGALMEKIIKDSIDENVYNAIIEIMNGMLSLLKTQLPVDDPFPKE